MPETTPDETDSEGGPDAPAPDGGVPRAAALVPALVGAAGILVIAGEFAVPWPAAAAAIGAVALATACEALDAVIDEAAPAHERALSERLDAGLADIPGVRTLRIWHDAPDRVGVHSLTVDGYPAALVAAYLSAEHGISVRDGKFCAHPLLARVGVTGGAIRASVGVGTTTETVDRLLAGLRAYVTDGPAAEYEVVDGCWAVADDPRPVPAGSGLEGLFATAAAGFLADAAGCGPAV